MPTRQYSKKILIIIVVCITSSFTEYVMAVDLKPVVPAPGYQHDRFNTQPKDIVRHFRAYTTSFDGGDDNNKNGSSDKWAIFRFGFNHTIKHMYSIG